MDFVGSRGRFRVEVVPPKVARYIHDSFEPRNFIFGAVNPSEILLFSGENFPRCFSFVRELTGQNLKVSGFIFTPNLKVSESESDRI